MTAFLSNEYPSRSRVSLVTLRNPSALGGFLWESDVKTARKKKQPNPLNWIVGGDTGISSKTIWSVMMGATPRDHNYPLDAADFGRCFRLLEMHPEWRPRLGKVAKRYGYWLPMVKAWPELEHLYGSIVVATTLPDREKAESRFWKRITAISKECSRIRHGRSQ